MNTDDPTAETSQGHPAAEHTDPQHYEIRVSGRLGSRWTSWFDGLSLTNEDGGTTVIRGPVVDQAALHGLLQKLRDLGIPLVSLTRVAPGSAAELSDRRTTSPDTTSPDTTSPNPTGATK